MLLFLRMNLIWKHEISNFLETFRSHPGKSLKVHFNLFSRILAYESEKNQGKFILIKQNLVVISKN